MASSGGGGTGKLAMSAFAKQFLKNPIQKPPTEDDDDDDSPMLYSTHQPLASSSRLPPQKQLPLSSSSTMSLPHMFNSQDSLADGHLDHSASSVVFDRHQEDDDNGSDDDDDGGGFLGRAEREDREKGQLLGASTSRGRRPASPPRPAAPPTTNRGWLAHQSLYPSSSQGRRSSSTGSTSSTSSNSSRSSSSSADSIPNEYLSESAASLPATAPRGVDLPRSERVRESSVWGMRGAADRGTTAGGVVEEVERLVGLGGRGSWGGRGDWRKFKDSPFLALHLFSLLALLVFFPFTLLFHPSLPTTPTPTTPPATSSPFRTLLHTIPLLSLLLLFVTAIPPLFLLALRRAVRIVIVGTGVVVVSGLMGGSWWLFLGSFEEVGEGETRNWWGGTGLRIISLFPFLAAILSARLIWGRRSKLARTVAVVELAIDVLLAHPPLLALTPALLAIFSVASLPFLVVIMRLLLLGYYESPPEGTYVYHLKPKATPLILLVVGLWVWMWGVFRGIARVTIAGVVGEWYFHRDDPALPNATTANLKQMDPFGLGFEIETTRIAFNRATGPSLGSICLSALIMAVLQSIRQAAYSLKKATSPSTISSLPEFFHPLNLLEPIFGLVASVLDQLNGYALVYVGITGEAFFPSARAVAGLIARRNKGSGRKLMDYTLIKLLLRLFALTIALLTATIGYLFATHALLAPWHAPLAGLLCGGTVWLSIRFSMDGLINAADALFICYAIDVENGGKHCVKAGEAFGGIKPAPRGPEAA